LLRLLLPLNDQIRGTFHLRERRNPHSRSSP